MRGPGGLSVLCRAAQLSQAAAASRSQVSGLRSQRRPLVPGLSLLFLQLGLGRVQLPRCAARGRRGAQACQSSAQERPGPSRSETLAQEWLWTHSAAALRF